MNAIAIDDEPPALKIIEKFCAFSNSLDLKTTFTKPQEAIKYLKKYPVDLIFIDVQMPSCNGIDFYKSLENKPLVIFTTAFPEYAVEGFNVNAVDYLLKPYTPDRFEQAIQKALGFLKTSHTTEQQRTLTIRSNYSLCKIIVDDIELVESLDDYLTIYLVTGKKITVRMTLKSMLGQLSPSEFVRVHRSYVLALSKIEQVRNKIISIGKKKIPIGNKYEKDFFDKFLLH
ncbi:MAG: LytTR family DNA-binding domain-containing protein [Paludibacter sp.]